MSALTYSSTAMPSPSASSTRRATVGSPPYDVPRALSRHERPERRAHPYNTSRIPRRASFSQGESSNDDLDHLMRGYTSISGSPASDSPLQTPAHTFGPMTSPPSRTTTLGSTVFLGSPAQETKSLIQECGHEYTTDPFAISGFNSPMTMVSTLHTQSTTNNIQAYPMMSGTTQTAPRGLAPMLDQPGYFSPGYPDPHGPLPPDSPTSNQLSMNSPHISPNMDESDPLYLRRRMRELELTNDLIREREAQAQARVAELETQLQNFSYEQNLMSGEPYHAHACSASSASQALGPAPPDWHARTQHRVRRFCSLNRAGNALCAWHDSRRERRLYPPRMAPPETMNCGCTYKEALFEEALARHGVGSYLPGGSVRMDPALRNGLLKLLERVYGYRDGDFERTLDGGWKDGEDAASWERRAISRPPRRPN